MHDDPVALLERLLVSGDAVDDVTGEAIALLHPLLDMLRSGECTARNGTTLNPDAYRSALQRATCIPVKDVRYLVTGTPLRHPPLPDGRPMVEKTLIVHLADAWNDRLERGFSAGREGRSNVLREELMHRVVASMGPLTDNGHPGMMGHPPNAEAVFSILYALYMYAAALRINDDVLRDALAPLIALLPTGVPLGTLTPDDDWIVVLLPAGASA